MERRYQIEGEREEGRVGSGSEVYIIRSKCTRRKVHPRTYGMAGGARLELVPWGGLLLRFQCSVWLGLGSGGQGWQGYTEPGSSCKKWKLQRQSGGDPMQPFLGP